MRKPPKVFKRGPYYHYDFWHGNERHTGSTGLSNQAKAQRFLDDKWKALIAETTGEKLVSGRRPMKLGIAAAHYFRHLNPGAPADEARMTRDQRDLARAIRLLCERIGGDTYLRDITDLVVAEMVVRRRGDVAYHKKTLVSPATVNRGTQLLQRIIRFAAMPPLRAEISTDDPPIWKNHLLKEPRERVRELSLDEETRLIAALARDDGLSRLVPFALLTGCRLNEMITLTWDKIDFDHMQFTITGKGDKDRTLSIEAPELTIIESCWGRHPAHVFTFRSEMPLTLRDGTVVREKGKHYPMSHDGWRDKWKAALKTAGITNFRFHDLRHTAATQMLRAFPNLAVLQDQLGHASPLMTRKYAHVMDGDRRAMQQKRAEAKEQALAGKSHKVPQFNPSGA